MYSSQCNCPAALLVLNSLKNKRKRVKIVLLGYQQKKILKVSKFSTLDSKNSFSIFVTNYYSCHLNPPPFPPF